MAETGISKKVFIATIGVQGIINMADGAEEKFKYAIVVGVIVIVFKVLQFLIDRKKEGN